MAWVSPKVYAILMNSEEGKDILEGIAEKDQDEVDKEVDAFFGKGGKGYSSNADYQKAKNDDEAEETAYKAMGDEDLKNNDFDEDTEELSDGDISEALADYQWQITDSTTVDDYARETAEKLGIDKQRVLDLIISEDPEHIKPDMKMSIVAGLEDEDEYDVKLEPVAYKIFKEYDLDGENPDNDPEIEKAFRDFVSHKIDEDGLREELEGIKTGYKKDNRQASEMSLQEQSEKEKKYKPILKKAFNALDKEDAMKIILSDKEVFKAFQKVQRENPNDSFWYQLSLLPDELL